MQFNVQKLSPATRARTDVIKELLERMHQADAVDEMSCPFKTFVTIDLGFCYVRREGRLFSIISDDGYRPIDEKPLEMVVDYIITRYWDGPKTIDKNRVMVSLEGYHSSGSKSNGFHAVA